MATLSEVRDLVVGTTGRDDKTSLIDSYINFGLKELARRHRWRELQEQTDIAITDGEDSVALPSDFHQLVMARLIDGTNSRKIKVRSQFWLSQRYVKPDELAKRKPAWGYLRGGKLHLIPTSDGSYTVRLNYSKRPATLSSNDTIPIEGSDAALEAYATYRVFKALEQFESSQQWFGEWE